MGRLRPALLPKWASLTALGIVRTVFADAHLLAFDHKFRAIPMLGRKLWWQGRKQTPKLIQLIDASEDSRILHLLQRDRLRINRKPASIHVDRPSLIYYKIV